MSGDTSTTESDVDSAELRDRLDSNDTGLSQTVSVDILDEQGQYRLYGTVADEDGDPIEGVEIIAWREGDED